MNSNGTSTTIRDNPCAAAPGMAQNSIAPNRPADAAIDLRWFSLIMLLLLTILRANASPFTRLNSHTRCRPFLYIRGQDRAGSYVRNHPLNVIGSTDQLNIATSDRAPWPGRPDEALPGRPGVWESVVVKGCVVS